MQKSEKSNLIQNVQKIWGDMVLILRILSRITFFNVYKFAFLILKISPKTGYCNVTKFLDRQVWANSADPDQTVQEQSDQGLHCLQFPLHLLDALLVSKAKVALLNIWGDFSKFLGVGNFKAFYGTLSQSCKT